MKDDSPDRDPADPDERAADLSSRDDPALLELLLGSPDRIHPQIVLWADGRVLPESDPGQRTLVGWHRGGGPVLLGVTTGTAREAALFESFHLAAVEGTAPVDRWSDPLGSFWADAGPDLRERIVERWGFEPGEIESPRSWTDRAWGAPPAPGPARTGVVAARVPRRLRRTVDWLADLAVEVAAWEILRGTTSDGPAFRLERVAGRWSGLERPLPAVEEERRRRTYVRHTGGVTAELLAELEATCRASGATVAWSGEEWVRFDGPARSLRVFPGTGWIDLQFVGADEGTLIGLRFRFGVAVGSEPPEGAPPGVHLRLSSAEDLGPETRLLVKTWLALRPEESGRRERSLSRDRGEASPDAPDGGDAKGNRPPGPGRERGRRNRSR